MERVDERLIEEEMKDSYVDYAMSVIVGRALPDVKDGLKPVHRRILYTMHQLGLMHNKPFRKSANVVGQCLANFHPHGDTAVYDSMVRMAQNFSLRYPLVKGQGNFGSVDGDSAAAMRYTEAKMQKLAEEMLEDIQKETVDFVDNYDGRLKEPVVLPAKFPNLLVNGSSGIAVGMATNIPPHNMREVINSVIAQIDNPDIELPELMESIRGPDFPTGGIICGTAGIKSAYKTGRGKVILRAKTHIEQKKGKERIIVTEIPYMVNKANLIQNIANLVKDKKIEGITDLRDESDRKGMRIVVELKKDASSEIILNQLYKQTAMQTTFGIIMLALHENQPKVMPLKDVNKYFIQHRIDVVTRRTRFDLKKAEERAHILEGLLIALKNVDEVIKGIKRSGSPEDAKKFLMQEYSLSEVQAQAILDMKLQKLTSMEQNKIRDEHKKLLEMIEDYKSILSSEQRIRDIIKDELNDIKENYADNRRTEIQESHEELEIEDLIEEEDVVVTVTEQGYVKRMPINEYKQQKRGGVGIVGTGTKEEDVVQHLFTTSTHNYILFFTNKGKVYWKKAFHIPEGSRYSKGKNIINLLRLSKDEKINAAIPIKKFNDDLFLIFATRKGLVKKTSLKDYSKPRQGGIIAIGLRDNDELVTVRLTPGTLKFIIGTRKGYAVKFHEKDVRPMGRTASGVRGIMLRKDDAVVGMEVALDSGDLLTITENGYGKRTPISDYRLISRGGKGVINIKTSERNGDVIGIKTVKDLDEVMIISINGIIIRVPVSGISQIGRNTQGVRVMRLRPGDKVTTIARVRESVKKDNKDEELKSDEEIAEEEAKEELPPTS